VEKSWKKNWKVWQRRGHFIVKTKKRVPYSSIKRIRDYKFPKEMRKYDGYN
jgi:hypothetical protein